MASKQGWNRNVLVATLIAVSAANASWAGDPDPRINMSQTKLACVTWFSKTLPNFFKQRFIDVTYWTRGYLSEFRATKAAFQKNPQLWESLNYTSGRRYYDYDNQLKIYNTEEDMASVGKKTLGFCWGHATMKFYFTRLSFFDQAGKHVPLPTAAEGSREWVDYYRQIIVKIANGEPAVVPGFANLREFSSHPKLIDWFRNQAAVEWVERMSSIFNAKYFLSKRDYTTAEGLKFIADLQERLAQGYNPKIIFDENSHKLVEGEQNSLHVVQVVGVHKLKNDKWAIEVVDDKFGVKQGARSTVADGQDETEVLYLSTKAGRSKKSTLGVYLPWRKKDMSKPFEPGNAWDMGGGIVNQFRIADENDIEAMKMALALGEFCKKNPLVCQELGDNRVVQRSRPVLEQAGGRFRDFEYAN